ncbi:MAG: AbrB/MazE/SpoVT family DNA-binding domain-containing protein [Actinobacteria bacterium]|nr:AbrB/MazE/SpoVT family DNA-binding domain-containing protein [Actinomycetota bacterium]MCL5883679.1 AbrB/MazE/SpoVT family DNA-binding domain-containing protein [Actinomycetota bacterium]
MATLPIRNKGQITLPAKIRRKLGLEEGDFVEIEETPEGILLKPRKLIDADQSYFWTEEWQKGELAADRDIEGGRYEVFDDVDDLVSSLKKKKKKKN